MSRSLLTRGSFCVIPLIRFRSKWIIMAKQMIGSKGHPHQVKSLMCFQDRTPEKGPSPLLPFLPSHIQISFIFLMVIFLSGGVKGRQRAESFCKTTHSTSRRHQAEPSGHSDKVSDSGEALGLHKL